MPVSASVAGLVVTIVATVALQSAMGLIAIPLAFAIGSAAKLLVLATALRRRIPRIPELAREDVATS
jgi:peptidoglycan biosynthesis protein MviN/MurJ (putative lipid II flippase)